MARLPYQTPHALSIDSERHQSRGGWRAGVAAGAHIPAMELLSAVDMTVPVSWVLGAIGILCGVISALALAMWGFVQAHITKQDAIIQGQGVMIGRLQDDVDRLSKGCGISGCIWKHRNES